MNCNDLTKGQARALLITARRQAKPVRPERLGCVGEMPFLPPHYANERGTFQTGGLQPIAEIPIVVEAWVHADREGDGASLSLFVNRTPITGEIEVGSQKKKLVV